MMHFNLFPSAGKYLPLALLLLLLAPALKAADNAGNELRPFYLSELYATADSHAESLVPFRIDAEASEFSAAFTCDKPYCPPDYEVNCLAMIGPDMNAPKFIPHFEADCKAILTHSDQIDHNPADPAYSAIVTRTWTVSNILGQSFTCVQLVKVTKATTPVLIVPADITDLSCKASTAPANTGQATVATPSGGVVISYKDQRVNGVGADCYTILRTWTAINKCGSTRKVQTITVADNQPPVFAYCPADLTVNHPEDVPAPETLQATDNCDTNVDISFTEVKSDVSCGPDEYILLRTWTATDNCGNTATCEQEITVKTTLTNECYSLVPLREYNSASNTTRFTYTLCLIGDDCKDISNIRFSIPCDLPKSALLESSSSMSGLKVEINGRTGRCERYDVQFEGFGDGAMKREPNQCVTFSYVIAGDLSGWATDVAIKAGNQTGLDFPGVGGDCSGDRTTSTVSTAGSEDFGGKKGGKKSLLQSTTQTTDITGMAVFPNPARDLISLRFESVAEQRVNVQVYDATGRVAFTRALEATPGSNTVEFSLGDIPAGLYQMVVTPAEGDRMVRSFLRLQ